MRMDKYEVLISIRPEWIAKIAAGEKTVEVRKSRPKQEPPFKCYIYCTKPTQKLIEVIKDGDEDYFGIHRGNPLFIKVPEGAYGYAWYRPQAIIGEFTCDALAPISFEEGTPTLHYTGDTKGWLTGLTVEQAQKYCGDIEKRGLWCWHISALNIYDKPKELKRFQIPTTYPARTIRQPPQSWCYIEEI